MIFAGIIGIDFGIHPFGYVTLMVTSLGLWLTLAPASAQPDGRAPRARASPRTPDAGLKIPQNPLRPPLDAHGISVRRSL
jgi:hypothetical protein